MDIHVILGAKELRIFQRCVSRESGLNFRDDLFPSATGRDDG